MEPEELKRKLMGLWEKTTHTSKELLSTLFDYYFNLDHIEYRENDGKVVSALCGIPYTFGFGKNRLKGLYIIPLSSEEGFHKKGILAELLSSFNEKVKEDFDFSFLIPHTDLMADYFGNSGYLSSFFILEERFTSVHDFRNDYLLSLNESDDKIRELKTALLDKIEVTDNKEKKFPSQQIVKFIKNIESKGTSSVNLCHDEKDLQYILDIDSIRDLEIFIAYDSDDKITGVMFLEKEEMKRLRVVAAYIDDTCSYYALLDFIKNRYPDYSVSINTSETKLQTHSLIQNTYAAANPAGGDLENTFGMVEIPFNINKLLQPLGMVRFLRFDRILKYIADTRSDVDFKVHIRDFNYNQKDKGEPESSSEETNEKDLGEEYKEDSSIPEKEISKPLFIVKNGKFNIEDYSKFKNNHSVLNLTMKEVSELLLRKNDSSNLIMEAFGIPRLNLQIRLLPC